MHVPEGADEETVYAYTPRDRWTCTHASTLHVVVPPLCVAGTEMSDHHVVEANTEKLGVTISLAYCCMTPLGQSGDTCPMLLMYDNCLEAYRAVRVSNKCLDNSLVERCVSTLDQAGYC